MTEEQFLALVSEYASVMDALADEVRTSDLGATDSEVYDRWATLEDLYDELQTQIGYFEDLIEALRTDD